MNLTVCKGRMSNRMMMVCVDTVTSMNVCLWPSIYIDNHSVLEKRAGHVNPTWHYERRLLCALAWTDTNKLRPQTWAKYHFMKKSHGQDPIQWLLGFVARTV